MDEKRIADYFVISGVSENAEFNTESKQLISPVLPITDITVIFRGCGEQCPAGYKCIGTTPGGHLADLNNGNLRSQNIQVCYRRGNDKPPLVDVGVYHEGKERVLPDVEVVYKTPYGRCASTGNNSNKYGTFITFRRAKTNYPFNQLVVVDLCVILNNKSEHPPHAFYSIKKNLNKSIYGMIGSEVFLCYKKTLLRPPSLCYTPQIISRFPLRDYANFPLPDTVPLFCLPTGANIELWPANTPLPRPISSTFVLTSDSAQKIYGFALTFYEIFDETRLTQDQKERLGLISSSDSENKDNLIEFDSGRKFEIYAIKSICILSRWPFFDCFEKFLMFLHRLVFNNTNTKLSVSDSSNSQININQVPLEHYISHFLMDVSFPTPERPTVIVQLMPGSDETVTISQPSNILPLPLTGASFCHLLTILGVENTMNVLLFGLSEQKILLHSLRPWVLTGVAEAILAMFFPFHWQCPYVPLCPLSLHGILNAPLPFIVGIDSRCFDTFTPPDDIICIDLDTRSIFLSEFKKCLNLRILPKRAARVLRTSLEKIFQKLQRVQQAFGTNQSPQHRSSETEASRLQIEKNFEMEIREAFVRFMATILSGFRTYLLPITSAPTVGATDPTSLFDFEGFLMSRDGNFHQFYQLITRTQMFTHYIEERSFVSDKDTSLAFFDDCEEKLTSSDDIFSDRPIQLFDKEDSLIQTDRHVYIPAPEQSPSISIINTSINSEEQLQQTSSKICGKTKFGPLNPALFHRHPQVGAVTTLDKSKQLEANDSSFIDKKILFDNHSNEPNSSFSISRRTKQEVKACQKLAKKSYESPLDWSKYLVSCCHSLWFSALPSYIAYCKLMDKSDLVDENMLESNEASSTSKILRYAYSTLIRMQRLRLTTDEICFRVLTLLCGHHGQPDLAVEVFFAMKKAGIKPNAVTYGYYNKAVLESKWPDEADRPREFASSVEYLADDNISSDETKSNKISESTQDHSESLIGQDDELGSLRNLTATTPNFKLASLINDASNLQWSRWTSSQNSKSVYKGIKSAATGIVSSLQEIKSSFSISNSNTPSKLLTSAHQYTSSATKEVLSQWASSMFATPAKEGDDDNSSETSSIESNDLIRLENEDDIVEEVDPEASDFRDYQQLFQALGEYHSNSSSREDLIDHLTDLTCLEDDGEKSSIAIIIKITTNSRCNACHSSLNDEDIMERWSPNESNLNTKCIHCGAKIVPFMKISLEDCRFQTIIESIKFAKHSPSFDHESKKDTQVQADCPLVDLNFSNDKEEVDNCQRQRTNSNSFDPSKLNHNNKAPSRDSVYNYSANENLKHNFTVPYLSPIVLRKELESVYEGSGDSCLASSRFVDEHPIVFWNLLWYFNRINVPTHLALLCLNAKSILNGRSVPGRWLKRGKVLVLNQARLAQEQETSNISKKIIQRRHSTA